MAIQTLTCWHTYATQKEDKNKKIAIFLAIQIKGYKI